MKRRLTQAEIVADSQPINTEPLNPRELFVT
jgi:hypothetical protein